MRAMTSQTYSEDTPYISHSDEAEYARMKELNGYGPTGDEDTELHEVLSEVAGFNYDGGSERS